MEKARHLLRPWSARLFRDDSKGARGRENSAEFIDLADPKTISPADIEDAFIKVNPGLPAAAIAVTCNRSRLSEVRICMGKDLQFRACDEIDRRACRRDQVTMPPVRGG